MRRSARCLAFFAIGLAALAAGELSDDQSALLDQLGKRLIDPSGLRWVSGRVTEYSCWGHSRERVYSGWLVPAQGQRPAFLVASHGSEYREPRMVLPGDFLAAIRDHITARSEDAKRRAEAGGGRERDDFRHVDIAAGRAPKQLVPVVAAAWLHRLGQDALAAQLLAAHQDDVPVRGATLDLASDEVAWGLFGHGVHAFSLRADAEALHNLSALAARFPKAVAADSQAATVTSELRRRQGGGRWSETAPLATVPRPRNADQPEAALTLPEGYAAWAVDKRVSHLIDLLDEVDARQDSQPGSVDLASDPRVAALIAIGDPAMPALIDCVANDQRLCRSLHFQRDFSRHREVIAVREAALVAALTVLHLKAFDPATAADERPARTREGAQAMVGKLRAYWSRYGALSFAERMMRMITDPQAGSAVAREAATNLAESGSVRPLGPGLVQPASAPRGEHPAIARFKDPTAAEAMLAAWDRDPERSRPEIRDAWLRSLGMLGDQRSAPELVRRFAAATALTERRVLARACLVLGEGGPSDQLAAAIASGAVGPPGDPGAAVAAEVLAVIADLAASPRDAARRGLEPLANPAHRFHALVAETLVASSGVTEGPDLVHPLAARVLLRVLDDLKPTGVTLSIEGDKLVRREGKAAVLAGIPAVLSDPAARAATVAERRCDRAAQWLGAHVVGLPVHHPLLKDQQQRLAAQHAALALWLPCLRQASDAEKDVLGGSTWIGLLIAAPKALERPATVADVTAGRALAVLGGSEVVALPSLPARARSADAGKDGGGILVFQAERRSDGTVVYAGLTRAGVVMLAADRLAGPPEALSGR